MGMRKKLNIVYYILVVTACALYICSLFINPVSFGPAAEFMYGLSICAMAWLIPIGLMIKPIDKLKVATTIGLCLPLIFLILITGAYYGGITEMFKIIVKLLTFSVM